MFAQHPSIVLRRFFKSVRPARSSAVQGRAALGSPFLFCQAFFLFEFAKQMTVVRQARKEAPVSPKKKAL